MIDISTISLPPTEELQEKAVKIFYDFLQEINVEYLDDTKVNLESIVKDYFDCNPPFENNIQKKYEFPDAIIISKLKQNFNSVSPLYIVSQDEGFRKAFIEERFSTFKVINELFDIITVQDSIYPKIVSNIKLPEVYQEIISEIENKILDGNIEIDGLDYDRKGLLGGYEYDETNINSVDNIKFEFVSVDDINDNSVSLTIFCHADIKAICSFTDYANSAWDGEEKRYRFLAQEEFEEDHNAEFECEINFEWTEEDGEIEFELVNVDFDLLLGQDTRQSRKVL